MAHSPLRNGQFVPDPDHQINLVAGENAAGDFEVYSRKTGGHFELLHTADLNTGAIVPLLPSKRDGYYLFADSATNPMRGLVAWNPVTDDRQEVFRHPNVDYDRLFVAPCPEVWAIRYVDHFPYYHYPDRSHPFVALHESLRARFKHDDVVIFDQSEDLSLALARTMGPKNRARISCWMWRAASSCTSWKPGRGSETRCWRMWNPSRWSPETA